MKNLEQIRAENALTAAKTSFKGPNDGDIVKKVPTMIMENGLLAAMAFAVGENKSGYEKVFAACLAHLGINMPVREYIKELSSKDSSELRAVTSEIMAYLSYLRRFAAKGE